MTDSGRLIVVSNRLPVSIAQEGDEWRATRSAGGLATAMDPILRKTGGIWIGWSGAKDEPQEVAEILRNEHGCIPVPLPADIAELFYEGYSNQALWPLFHSFTTRLRFEPDAWGAYIEANKRFCDAVAEQFQEGDRIWVHDYHLMLLPGMLRERLPNAPVGFFLHIPFPASDIFSLLPRADELLAGLIGADVIAFHTHTHLQHFRRSVRRLLGVESKIDGLEAAAREVKLVALPIGSAPDEFLGCLTDPETKEQIQKLEAAYSERKLIVAVDRLDYTKGLPERLRAYRQLLKSEPELQGKVVLLQIAVPSRENIESYQELTSEVHQLVSEINGKFGTPDWIPVVYIHRGISRPELVALYHLADVGWVSPLRDGMNLVAKEYVSCKPDGNGVLVLSSFAGAAAEMGEALLVNPYDEERTAAAVSRALSMGPEEKTDRMSALHDRVLRNDVFAWGDRFLAALKDAEVSRKESSAPLPVPVPSDKLHHAYARSARRVLFLDYDGTLVGFTARPQDAAPDDALVQLLGSLASDPENAVVVISGRRTGDLERWLGGIPGLGLAAEHGARWRAPRSNEWRGEPVAQNWKQTVRPILDHFTDRTPGSCVEEKEFALVWHYRMAEPEFGDWLATELTAMLDGMLAETELRAYRGNKIVEVKPLSANKGAFASTFLQSYGEVGFMLAAGDDRTDEDLFASLPDGAWLIHIGNGISRAAYRAASPADFRQLLSGLVASSS
ncbi:MAG TPA: bifunctional alpha,alpha-trehalose-phosphate synthase (UDP-forming)/trehalose-phosphatase [Bryobacteraceae bacterium]|nr:bifunctional alpha,alpha-trehalose-phosphate synthase (UDP-forming)/trehalose-phosphatase [Bryobacteraceae bacterium]